MWRSRCALAANTRSHLEQEKAPAATALRPATCPPIEPLPAAGPPPLMPVLLPSERRGNTGPPFTLLLGWTDSWEGKRHDMVLLWHCQLDLVPTCPPTPIPPPSYGASRPLWRAGSECHGSNGTTTPSPIHP